MGGAHNSFEGKNEIIFIEDVITNIFDENNFQCVQSPKTDSQLFLTST